ncbi:MAG TPA: BrxA/BrxB family bacilliredoxin [Gemmatimonadaceae bacterium]|nr:BrxA/BrxB family bacilliredoxin [Gemmatimonadaceae bacterium]
MSVAYDERFLAPMRAELTRLGVRELKTTDEVDAALKDAHGTTLVVVNSICGCAARNARPAVTLALAGGKKPDALTTVFAGQDLEATARARSYLEPYGPSSPSIALLKDGAVAYMMERKDIEGRDAAAIAHDLTQAFERFC